jgi:transcriptional regulator with XRE-family HTH domain
MDMIGKVRRMKLRDGLSYSEIARRTGLSRNTVKKWIKAGSGVEPQYRRDVQAGKLTPFEATLVAALKADAPRPSAHGQGVAGATAGAGLSGRVHHADGFHPALEGRCGYGVSA